jgi:DUF1680 family protein
MAAITGEYIDVLKRIWEKVVFRNMYIHGGVGSTKKLERFTGDYDLPNETGYCETCAAAGMVFWNHRMNLLFSEGKYADIVERVIYNGLLSGVSLKGDRFFYANRLKVDAEDTERWTPVTNHRQDWFYVACCPTQIARFIPSIGNYIYAVSESGIFVNLYIGSKVAIPFKDTRVNITQVTDYPWDGRVEIILEPVDVSDFEVNLRMPGWSKGAKMHLNGEYIKDYKIKNGYIVFEREWNKGDRIVLELDMLVERVQSHPEVKANKERVAIQRGPIVYCVEEMDSAIDFDDICLFPETKLVAEHRADLLGGVTAIRGIGPDGKMQFTAVPYYAWDNREPGRMEVWLREKQRKH